MLSQAQQSKVSQPFLIREIFLGSNHLWGPSMGSTLRDPCLLGLRSPELGTVLQILPQQNRVEEEDHRITTSLTLLAMLFLMNPRIPLAFLTTNAR